MEVKTDSEATIRLLRRALEKSDSNDEILAVVEEIVSERDELLRRQTHLHSLARLVEKTVSDADDLAAEVKKEAEDAAQAKAKEIMAQAEATSRAMLEDTRARGLSETQSEISAMRAAAEEDLKSQLKEWTSKLQAQVKETAESLRSEMLVQVEESKRRFDVFEVDLGKVLSSLCSNAPAAYSADGPGVDGGTSRTKADDGRGAGPAEVAPAAETDAKKPVPPVSPATDSGASVVDVEILPPRDKGTIDNIAAYLNGLDEVLTVQTRHLADKTVLEVELRLPLDIAAKLSDMPQVEQVRQFADNGHTRIETVLTVRSEMEKQRKALDAKAKRLASRIPEMSR